MDYEKVLGEHKFPTYEELKTGLIRLIDEGKISQEDAARLLPELRESEDDRINRAIFKALSKKDARDVLLAEGVQVSEALDYLEKQKEPHKRLRDKTPWIVTAKEELAHDEERLQANLEELHRIRAEKEKQKEQKPNIELIQRSWYMEGYHDREFGKEPMWIIKTGKGGPKHELNPKYGQLLAKEQKPGELDEELELGLDRARQIVFAAKGNLEGYQSDDGIYECDSAIEAIDEILKNGITTKPVEKQDYSGLNDLERAILRGFLVAGVENVPVGIIKETAQECLAQMKTAWSEEDRNRLEEAIGMIEANGTWVRSDDGVKQVSDFLKALPERFNIQPKQEWGEEEENKIESIKGLITTGRFADTNTIRTIWKLLDSVHPRPSWKPNERQMEALESCFCEFGEGYPDEDGLRSLYNDLKKL